MVSANEKIASGIRRHFIDLTRYDAGLRQKVLRQLNKLEKDLVGKIAASGFDKEGIEKLSTKRYKQFLDEVKGSIASTYSDIKEINTTETQGLAQIESTFVTKQVNKTIGVEAAALLNESQLKQIVKDTFIQGTPLKELWDRQERDITDKFIDKVRLGMLTGETNEKIIKSIRGTRANSYKDGIFETTRSKASTLVRTEVAAVANNARLETYRENSDIIDKLVVFVTFDKRTSDICIARSGLEYTLDGEPIGHDIAFDGGPPYHPNCRTVLVPVTKEFKDMGIDKEEIPQGTRSTLDGQVPEDLSFTDWLKTRTIEEQEEILGVGKAELWRDGKIDLKELVNNDGRPLTLEKLKKKVD